MDRSPLRHLVILAVCISLTFILSYCSKGERQPITSSAPDFTLKTLDNQEITLSKLRGKVVLLDFWATWCAPCRESIPHLVQLYKTHQQNGLEVIGMSMDRGDVDTVRRFVKSMDVPYPVVMTPEDVARNYGVTGLPTTVLIDREGRIQEKVAGFSDAIAKQMVARVENLTSKKP